MQFMEKTGTGYVAERKLKINQVLSIRLYLLIKAFIEVFTKKRMNMIITFKTFQVINNLYYTY